MCAKVTYHTYDEAERTFKKLRAMIKKGKKKHLKMPEQVYMCPKCGKYHLSSMPLAVYETNLLYSKFFN